MQKTPCINDSCFTSFDVTHNGACIHTIREDLYLPDFVDYYSGGGDSWGGGGGAEGTT